MAVGESAGTVYVTIDGDASPLLAKYAQAETASRAAGQTVAAGFNAAATGSDLTSASITDLIQVIREESAAASLATQRNIAIAASFRQVGQAAHGSVSEIQATSGALRVLEGNSALRAAERFLTTIPGLGAALQYAFPVVGAIALFEGMSRLLGKSEELKAAEKELADATNKADEAFATMEHTLDHLNVEHVKNIFGAAAGTGAGASVLEQQAKRIRGDMDDLKDSINEVAYAEANSLKNYIPFHSNAASVDKIKVIGQQYKELAKILQETEAKAGGAREDQGRELQTQYGQLAAKRIESAEQASTRASEISKQRYDSEIDLARSAETQRIAGLDSEYARVVQTGNEEIRFEKAKQDEIAGYALATRDRTIKEIAAKAGAESAGKTRPEQALIQAGAQADTSKAKDEFTLATGKAALDTQKAQADAALKLDDLNQKLATTLANNVREGWDKVDAAAKKTLEYQDERIEKEIAGLVRVQEIQDKSEGEVKSLQIAGQKIALEAQYSQKIVKTGADRVAYLQQIASLEAQETAVKIAGLEAEKKDAEALADKAASMAKVAEIQGQIDAARQQGANQQATAQAEVAAAQRQNNVGYQIGQGISKAILQTLPQALGNALASSIFDHRKGDSAGKQLGQAAEGVGKKLVGEIFTHAIEKLVATIVVQTGLQAAFNAIFPVSTTTEVIATSANTVASIANTSAVALLTAVMLATAGFADGTSSAPGGMALVGEKGPEIVNLPRGSQVIPNHAIHKYADGTPGYNSSSTHYQSTSFQTGTTNLHFHAHGMSDPNKFVDHVMRKIPEALKRTSPGYSAYSH